MLEFFFDQVQKTPIDPAIYWAKQNVGLIFGSLIIIGVLGLFITTELPRILERHHRNATKKAEK